MKSVWKGAHIVLIVVCTAVFLIGGIMLVDILAGYAQADKTYEDINDGFETLGTIEPEGESEGETEKPDESTEPLVTEVKGLDETMQSQYDYLMQLKATYPDVVGYISIPTLSINYPVVQTDNNDYYLNHLITGQESSSGSIFLDYRCDYQASTAKNTVLYGHNMNNRSMFHNLKLLFTEEVFWNATVEYITEEGIFIYKPLTLYRENATYPFWQPGFGDDEAYLEFCRMVTEKSCYKESASVTYGAESNLITLVTCTNSVSTKTDRYVYQAVLERIYFPED